MSLSNRFDALATASALLAGKVTLVHLLCARTRLMIGKPAQPEDSSSLSNAFFKGALFCTGPSLGGLDFILRCERVTANCAQNEPFFLLLALLGELSGKVPHADGERLLVVYCAARTAHTAAYFLGPKLGSALRSLSYSAGAFTTLGFAGLALGFGQ